MKGRKRHKEKDMKHSSFADKEGLDLKKRASRKIRESQCINLQNVAARIHKHIDKSPKGGGD